MKQIAAGFKEAKNITRRHAKTFYLASLFLSEEERYFSYSVYAICRLSDQCVDGFSLEKPQDQLKILKEKIEAVYSQNVPLDNLLSSLRFTVEKCQIPKDYFYELINGMEMDLIKGRYADFEELRLYCYRVASVVGLIMLKILGAKKIEAQKYAIDLGIAMQLTNIIRDLKEDFQMGRIYIPLNEMSIFGINEESFKNSVEVTRNLKLLIASQIKRSREYYRRSAGGIKFLPNLRTRFVVLTMKEMYSAILKEVEFNNYDVFSKRAFVKLHKKVIIILKILIKGEYLCR